MTRRSRAARALRLVLVGLPCCGLAWGAAGRLTAQQPRERPAASPTAAASALVPEPARLAAASAKLVASLGADPFNYFRFVNLPWAQRVCEAFAGDLRVLPTVHLHGDAHVEQYAYTSTARGLDDFDDSALGPSVIDLVRFLGSVELAARARGWEAGDDFLFDRFLAGYRAGLADRNYLPPEPAVVARLRATRPARDDDAFLAWAESLMQPNNARQVARATAAMIRLDTLVRGVQQDLPVGYLRLKKIGWLRMGVGSGVTRKILARVEGPGPSPHDDAILEAKELSDLRGVACLSFPEGSEAVRVLSGAAQLGRLRHEILAIVPKPPLPGPDTWNWWVRSWDRSYAEVTLRDYASVDELAEVVHDAGAQLGAGSLRDAAESTERQKRQLELESLARLEPRIRSVARQLVSELVEQWTKFKALKP